MFKNILVPLDGSANSKRALDSAIEIAKDDKSKLFLLSIINTTTLYYGSGTSPIMPNDLLEDQEKFSQHILDDAVAKVKDAGVDYNSELKIGNPKDIIAEAYPKANNIDLIVIGKTGKDALGKLLIGSTTSYVVRESPYKVMVV